MTSAPPGVKPRTTTLSAREAKWVLRRCGRRGHVLAYLEPPVAAAMSATGGDDVRLLRCLRCGCFIDPADHGTPIHEVFGTADAPADLATVPQVLRGSHGRKLALLRVLALERGVRGLFLLLASAAIARLATSHTAVADWVDRLAQDARPLGNELHWDVAHSPLVSQVQSWLGHSSGVFSLVAWLVAGYGGLLLVEAIGLWGGWRWAEYLAAVATSLFIPLEIYEVYDHVTVLKVGALVVNLAAVGYLVVKGRLFGVRGGHLAYLAEVRDATLLAEEVLAANLPTTLLANHATL